MRLLKKKKQRNWWIILPGCGLILGLLIVLILYLTAPAVGIIEDGTSASALPDYGTKEFSGRLFSFAYDGSLKTLEYMEEPTGMYLEKVILTTGQPLSFRLAIGLRRHEESTYTEVPDIKKRRLEPDIYTEEPFVLGGRNGLIFKRTAGGFEETVFVPRDASSILSISLTSAELGRKSELAIKWQQVIDSFVLR